MLSYKYIRKLAKTSHYQTLFALSKEINGIQIFDNIKDFSDAQVDFLRYLNFYSSLLLDIALNEVDERVLEKELYEDSYMLYKNKKDKSKPQYVQRPEDSKEIRQSRWLFKQPPKK